MQVPYRKVLAGILCAAALMVPVWAEETGNPAESVEAVETLETILPEATNLPDNDALFYGYLLHRAGVSDDVALMASAGSSLSGKDKDLYDQLKALITKIADGTETSTIYTITYNDFPKTLTAAELGVTNCFSDAGKAAIQAKAEECYDYDTDAVFDALLVDCPYELYWYDKSESGGVGFDYSGAAYKGNSQQVTITEVPSFTVTMSVSQDYALRVNGGTSYNPTKVDRSLHAGIENVVAKAKSIVSDYQSKGDYDKLLGYSTEICNLVKYNDDAASSSTNTPYGDPWQLISVFDADSTTNVVCEGYAKAFKYLCDLSTFNSSKVECYLVSGILKGGTGAGPHMWNIVTMENGKNYHVDITNSDSNEGPEYLLLKGGTPDSQNSMKYTFYDWLSFTYDDETIKLWGSELLTLDTVDYKDAAPVMPLSAPVQVRGCSLTLVDDIALNFYLTLDETVTADNGAVVTLSGPQDSDTRRLAVSEAFQGTVDGIDGTVYRFTAHIPAKRMNDKITLVCYDGNHQPYAMTNPAGESVTEFRYCVQDYLKRAASETALKTLAESMSTYGYYAQKLFQYDTANAVTPSASTVSAVAVVTADTLSAYAPVDSGSVTGLLALGDNLLLESAITQRCIFRLDGSVSDYAFRLDGSPVTPKAYDESSYYVEIPGIVAKDLDKTHTLTISKGTETFTHQCSTLSYASKALTDSSSSEDLQNLVRALYLYHTEAKSYFQSR